MIRWLLDRANAHTDKVQAAFEERLSAWVEIWKERDSLLQREQKILRDEIKVLEGRIERLDAWTRTVAMSVGVGAPMSGETTIEGFDDQQIDPLNDTSLEAMLGLQQEDEDLINEMLHDA